MTVTAHAPPPLRCSSCARAVVVLDGRVIRACRCDAPVVGEMSATVYAAGGVSVGPPSQTLQGA